MDAKKLALLVGALTTAGVTAVMARHMSNQAVAPQALAAMPSAPVGPSVLVATKPLPVGTILTPDSFSFQPWPKENVDNAYFVQGAANVDPSKMAGWVVRNAITAGQPLTQGSLVSPHDRGFLAAALTPGMRAVTIAVTGANAVAGFVFPGDHVDLVLTSNIDVNASASSAVNSPIQVQVHDNRPLQVAETFLRNVRVLATDQRTDNTPTPDGKTSVTNYSLVTVEATPKIAEKIAVAQKLGSLSLSLRPLADSPQQLAAATDPKATAGQGAAGTTMPLDPGPQDSGASATVGADVSRFARAGFGRTGGSAQPAPSAMPAGAPSGGAAPVYSGPAVRVSRGGIVTNTPVQGGF